MIQKSINEALRAARLNIAPAIILWAFASLILLLYYGYAPSRPVFETVSSLKTRYGYLFSMLSTAFFGGLLPFIFLRAQRATRLHAPFRHLPFLMLLWAAKGAEVDFLYRMQSVFFGNAVSLPVVLLKMAVDQLVYVPFWGIPTLVLLLMWKEREYSFRALRSEINRTFYLEKVVPVLIPNAIVWVPTAALIYCLPPPLQVPMQNIVLCMWVLILTVILRRG